jgi:hypothetical protein
MGGQVDQLGACSHEEYLCRCWVYLDRYQGVELYREYSEMKREKAAREAGGG